jgi:hypothetical protein
MDDQHLGYIKQFQKDKKEKKENTHRKIPSIQDSNPVSRILYKRRNVFF